MVSAGQIRLLPSHISLMLMIKYNSKYNTVLLHIIIWSILFALPHFFIDNRNIKPGFFPGSFFIVTNLYHIGLFYLNAFLLFPLLFNKRRWWLFILAIAAVIAVSYYLKLFITIQWYPEVTLDKWANRILFFPPLIFLFASTIYRMIVDKTEQDKKQKEMIAEQLAIKLKFLRSQINPHFIFNVLTNLVSLARKKSELLEPALIRLSDLMRYMLYESDEKKVALSKEVEYLKSYIELQKLRFGDDVAIDVNIQIPENEMQQHIEPMLLIPFVENAFKHGLGVDEPFIQINLTVSNGKLGLTVKNNFNSDGNESKDLNSGIGLENVQSRLTLLYPKRHSLLLKQEKNLFHIHLILQLR
jgi:two-component system LytT family sensor kinase